MKIKLNGTEQSSEVGTIAELIQHLALPIDKIAIERNAVIVTRGDYDTTQISDGDNIEIIEFVGGG